MRRRDFVTLIAGGAAAAWPLRAHAQQGERVRRVGVLNPATADDAVWQARIGAFQQELALLGWNIGRNVRIDIRWATTDATEIRKQIAELLALAPDVILAAGDSTAPPLLQATRTVPIVFPVVTDPVGAGYVDSLARPGGNVTGFMVFEFGTSGKLLELLKEIAPSVTRAAVIRDPTILSGTAQFGAIQAVAPSLQLEVIPVSMRDAGEIEQSVKTFARSPNGGLVVTASAAAIRYRDLIVTLAARYKLPAVYWARFFVAGGGLISYGPDLLDNYRRAAGYVDRILKGEKPADLPVQAPTKYESIINLKTAKTLGLTFPPAARSRRRSDRMKRRQFITLFGGAVLTWPATARAQKSPIPVVAFISGRTREGDNPYLPALWEALAQSGFTDGKTMTFAARWADGQYARVPVLAGDLIGQGATVIIVVGTAVDRAVQKSTSTIPVVFVTADDPVAVGLVGSLNRPSGNITGVTMMSSTLRPKMVELLHTIVSNAKSFSAGKPKQFQYRDAGQRDADCGKKCRAGYKTAHGRQRGGDRDRFCDDGGRKRHGASGR